ncbi:MAG: hypothetical protein KH326_10520, partial [Ruminococcus callidus]
MWYTILLKCALTHYDTFYYYIMQAFFCQGRFFIFVGMPLKHVLFRFFFVNLHKPDGTAADSKGNTAQSPPDGFARNLCADFPSYCPERASGDFARHLLANFSSYFTKMLVNTSSIHSAF